MSKTEGCPPLILPVGELTKEVIDLYAGDPGSTHEIHPTGPVVVVRNCDIIAAIRLQASRAIPPQ